MIRIRVAAVLALSTLAFPVSIAHGQQIFGPGGTAPTANQGSATGRNVPQCQAAPGGSRMRNRNSAECDAAAARSRFAIGRVASGSSARQTE